MASKKSRREKSRQRRPGPPVATTAVPASGGPLPGGTKRPGRLFWICLLVLIEALIWTAVSAATDSGPVQMIVALGAGTVFVVTFRHRIWGPDWRDEVAASRARRPR